jgi:(2R)-3-sulfolactate dehydrogenase (NADP+)
VIDPDALAGRAVYLERVETLIAEMQKDAGVRLPGARRGGLGAKARETGVEIPAALAEQLQRLANA